jgi:hypothetical protein
MESMEGTPIVMRSLLARFDDSYSLWDMRPNPDRFTLREVVAHLADWDEIFLDRLRRTVNEDNPLLTSIDAGQLAIDHDYAAQSPSLTIERFTKSRSNICSFVSGVPDSAFDRLSHRAELGTLSFERQITLILAHDGYHLRQAAEYIMADARP